MIFSAINLRECHIKEFTININDGNNKNFKIKNTR